MLKGLLSQLQLSCESTLKGKKEEKKEEKRREGKIFAESLALCFLGFFLDRKRKIFHAPLKLGKWKWKVLSFSKFLTA